MSDPLTELLGELPLRLWRCLQPGHERVERYGDEMRCVDCGLTSEMVRAHDRRLYEVYDRRTTREREAAVRAATVELHDLLHCLWLYLRWRFVTTRLTTEQKILFADAIDESSRRNGEDPIAERWWDWPSCEICRCPVEPDPENVGRWLDLWGSRSQIDEINWAGVGTTPPHFHRSSQEKGQ
jgi:hypothetical protein